MGIRPHKVLGWGFRYHKHEKDPRFRLDYPYPHVWCVKGHWEGLGEESEPEVDHWKDCKDFEEHGNEN